MRPGTFHGLNLIFSLPKLLQVTARPLQNSGEIRRGSYESGRLLGVKLSTRAVLAAVLSAVTAAAAYLGLIPLMVVVGSLTADFFRRRGVYPYQMVAAFFVQLFGWLAMFTGAAASFVRLING